MTDLSAAELRTLRSAYAILTRHGNETEWTEHLDKAQHYLALVLIDLRGPVVLQGTHETLKGEE